MYGKQIALAVVVDVTGTDARGSVAKFLYVENDLGAGDLVVLQGGAILIAIDHRVDEHALGRTRGSLGLFKEIASRILGRVPSLGRDCDSVFRNPFNGQGEGKKSGGKQEAGQCIFHDSVR